MILQRTALYPQMRLDVPDARAIEAFGQNDWIYFLKGILTNKSQVISGFDITNYANIFTVPGVQLSQNNVAILHPEATTQAAGFYVSSGTEADYRLVLSSNNSTTTTNFVEVDLSVTTGSPDTRAFWDAGANGGQGAEFTDTVDTVINLNLSIDVNISGFTTGRIPLYKIVTNPDGTVNSVTDCRPMLFRLGTGGTSPNPGADATYANSPDSDHARFETPSTAHSATTSNLPFQGGDKNIKNLKTWMDWVMADLKELKQTPYWYMKPQASVAGVYLNSAMTLLQGGHYVHISGQTGHLSMANGSVIVRMGLTNSTTQPFTNFNLNSNDTLFVLLSQDGSLVNYQMGQDSSNPIVPKDLTALTTNSFTVATGGNYKTAGGTLLIRGIQFTYTAYNSSTGLFTGVSPDPTGVIATGDTVYQDNTSGNGYYHQAAASRLPGLINSISEGAERVFWIAYFDGVNTIFIRDAQLVPGESADAGEIGSDQLFQYIGSTGPADNFPIYNVNSIPNGTNLTAAISDAYKIIETPIYDEKITTAAGVVSTYNDQTNGNTSSDSGDYFTGGASAGAWRAASFVLSSTTTITDVRFRLASHGTPPVGNILVQIRNDASGTPGTTRLFNSSVPTSSIVTGQQITVSTSNLSLPAGTYWFVLGADATYQSNYSILTNSISPYIASVPGKIYWNNSFDNPNGNSGWQQELTNTTLDYGYTTQTTSTIAIAANSVVFLPTNSKTSTSASYSLGTDELEVYENGILLTKGYDYTELTSNSIQVLRDIYNGAFLRFRIASIGGAGASAGGGSGGLNLQDVYNNGRTMTVASGQPMVINGPSGQKLLHVAGDVQIDGLLDPTGVQITPVASTPIPNGQMGFWIDSATNQLMFTKHDATTLQVQAILETQSGNTPNFTRTMTNHTGATIAAGTPVYMSDTDQIALADADDDLKSRFFGFTKATVADGASVGVIFSGVVPGVMASTGLPTNTRIWLSTTPGVFSDSPPTTSGSYQIQIGLVCGNDLILQVQDFGQVQ